MEKAYLDALTEIMNNGIDRAGRNGSTRAKFAIQMRHDFKDGFPALTSKKLAFKAVKSELLWFLEGSGDDNRLKKLNGSEKTIWTANAEADYWKPKAKFAGDLGRVYGVQWRSWMKPDGTTVDQIARVVDKIKNDPNDRRLIVSAWNPGELDEMALPPCHMLFQFFVAEDKLSLHMVQRSCDMFLGVPFNIASYALLTMMVAQVCDLVPGDFVHSFGDAHLYLNHLDQARTQLARAPRRLPTVRLNPAIRSLFDFRFDDVTLVDYDPHPAIKAPVAV